jgi:hypothetical protein
LVKQIRRKPGRAKLNVEIVLSLQIYVRREEYQKMSAGQSNLTQGREGERISIIEQA